MFLNVTFIYLFEYLWRLQYLLLVISYYFHFLSSLTTACTKPSHSAFSLIVNSVRKAIFIQNAQETIDNNLVTTEIEKEKSLVVFVINKMANV